MNLVASHVTYVVGEIRYTYTGETKNHIEEDLSLQLVLLACPSARDIDVGPLALSETW